MKKFIVLIIIVVGLLFVGCDLPGLGADARTSGLTGSSASKSNGDTKGVVLTFSEGNPPKEMYNEQDVTFGFVFTNHQEHEITDLKVKVSGFDSSYVKGLNIGENAYSVNNIPKATSQSGNGIYAGLAETNVKVNGFEEKYNFNPKFDYCYSAKSTLVEQVCVPSKQSNTCEVQVDKMYNTNGPVVASIDNIINKDNGGRIRVFFSVENKGSGNVVNNCFEEDYANEFSVSSKLGTQSGQCESVSGEYKIINNKASFYCDFTRSSDESYSSQISVELDYSYEQSTKKEILVKDINQG